jgi:hypothetical protein
LYPSKAGEVSERLFASTNMPDIARPLARRSLVGACPVSGPIQDPFLIIVNAVGDGMAGSVGGRPESKALEDQTARRGIEIGIARSARYPAVSCPAIRGYSDLGSDGALGATVKCRARIVPVAYAAADPFDVAAAAVSISPACGSIARSACTATAAGFGPAHVRSGAAVRLSCGWRGRRQQDDARGIDNCRSRACRSGRRRAAA